MFRLTNRLEASRHAGVLVGLCLVVGRLCLAEPLPPPRLQPMARPSSMAVDGMYGGMMADASATAIGAASCATASCHGGPAAGNHDVQSFAATLWATTDPHAGAYETLHEPRSRRMAAMLGIEEPHRARRCLVCHSVQAERPEPLAHDVLADGVSCGSCHGDATKWLAIHHLPEWKDIGLEARVAMDFREMSDVVSRARTCIPCHVGDGSREVDHDLVAAGHPRLAFEFAAYQRLWPRHWSPRGKAESQADFAERAWAAGQAETLAAVARLVAVRARRAAVTDALPVPGAETIDTGGRPSSRWPEFAEFDCYACHRALSPDRVAERSEGPLRNPFPGAPSWQPWSVSAARLLAAAVEDSAVDEVGEAAAGLRAAFEPDWTASDRRRLDLVIERAESFERAAVSAGRAITAAERVVLDGSHETLDAVVAADRSEWRFWDAAAQTYLLMEAAGDGGPARIGLWPTPGRSPSVSRTREALDDLRASLRFPPGSGGPDRFDPTSFERDRRAVSYGRPSAR